MENPTVQLIEDLEFSVIFEGRFASIFEHPESKSILCQLKAEYIPIDPFKEIFDKVSESVKKGDIERFIFDKRSLKTFHQPSMEWYFVVWKKEMFEYGLAIHRKILPSEKWFETSVRIAKEQIIKNYPDNIIDHLDIKYCQGIKEALVS